MSRFLIKYNRRTESLEYIEFSEADGALAIRALRAAEAKKPDYLEVVLLEAASLDDAKRTHSRYFQTARELIASDPS